MKRNRYSGYGAVSKRKELMTSSLSEDYTTKRESNEKTDANDSGSSNEKLNSNSKFVKTTEKTDTSKRNSSYESRNVDASPSKVSMYSSLDELDLHLKIKKYEERRNQRQLRTESCPDFHILPRPILKGSENWKLSTLEDTLTPPPERRINYKKVRFAITKAEQEKEKKKMETLKKIDPNFIETYERTFFGSTLTKESKDEDAEEDTEAIKEAKAKALMNIVDTQSKLKNIIVEISGEKGKLFKYVQYKVTYSTEEAITIVYRRYNDFYWLYKYLVEKYPYRQVPLIPEKRGLLGKRFDTSFIEHRRAGLQTFLNKLSENQTFSRDNSFIIFTRASEDDMFQLSKEMLTRTMKIEDIKPKE